MKDLLAALTQLVKRLSKLADYFLEEAKKDA